MSSSPNFPDFEDTNQKIGLLIVTAIVDVVFGIFFNALHSYGFSSPNAISAIIAVYAVVMALNGMTAWFVVIPEINNRRN